MYKGIGDYGIIGNMYSAALVSKCGSIDYCSLPYLDSATIFCALLDDEKGGFFKIAPTSESKISQQYIDKTNVLQTNFLNDEGRTELLDYMPVEEKEPGESVIIRNLNVLDGTMDFVMEYMPRPKYASYIPEISLEGSSAKIMIDNNSLDLDFYAPEVKVIRNENGKLKASFQLKKGQRAVFRLSYGKSSNKKWTDILPEKTISFWRNWISKTSFFESDAIETYRKDIERSLLTLKLLTFAPTGAISAAVTTSLPEAIGQKRNWDYRFTWLRDATFTLDALYAMGHHEEAINYEKWLYKTFRLHEHEKIKTMYSLESEENTEERILDYLKGFKNSKPVRVGNAAHNQLQLDIYGEILNTAWLLSESVQKLERTLWPFYIMIVDFCLANWHQPDSGIWEFRTQNFHFTYSKAMCWLAAERAIKLAHKYKLDAPISRWQNEIELIKTDILNNGYDPMKKSFVQRYGYTYVDSSLLRLGLMGFLPFSDERIQGTIKTVRRELSRKGFLSRYNGPDGLEGPEGAFVVCNFWLIQCLAYSGQIDEAHVVLEMTQKAANHLGLFAEEYDPDKKILLGNFPQALSHLGFINAVKAIDWAAKQSLVKSR